MWSQVESQEAEDQQGLRRIRLSEAKVPKTGGILNLIAGLVAGLTYSLYRVFRIPPFEVPEMFGELDFFGEHPLLDSHD